jgi:phosphoserine phosphatase
MLGIVAFDLDGTLIRGATVCELLAAPLGRDAEMRRFEACTTARDLRAARSEMACWYRGHARRSLCRGLADARWAPGAREAVAELQGAGIEVVIASVTWRFAVAWFAERLAVRRFLGTGLSARGEITHVWPQAKASWLRGLARELGVPRGRTAAVGDSTGDLPMLRSAALRFFVGASNPPGLPVLLISRARISAPSPTPFCGAGAAAPTAL